MVITLTPTEFNRTRSTVMQSARDGDTIIVKYQDGGDVLIKRVDKPLDIIDEMLANGTLKPPRRSFDEPFKSIDIDPVLAREIIDEFENERI